MAANFARHSKQVKKDMHQWKFTIHVLVVKTTNVWTAMTGTQN